MEPDAEPVTVRTVLGWGVLAFVITAIAAPIELWVGPGEHALVVRLAGAAFAASVIWRLAAAARGAVEAGRPRAGDLAQQSRPEKIEPDAALVRLTNEVRASTRERYYFARALWPRLERLAHKRHVRLPPAMPPRLGRPVRNDELASLLAAIEEAE